jgi:hypothetical protein
MSHAENRANDCGRERAQPKLQIHHAVDVRAVQNPESMHDVSHVADERMGEGTSERLVRCLTLEAAVKRVWLVLALAGVIVAAAPAAAQECTFLCEPTLLIEPTITFEKDATVFETVFAVDLSTPIPRVGVTLEAITKPFSDENDVEIESELNLTWLESRQTGGWLSSHFDIIDKFSGAERATDTRSYTHKLNFEFDTAVAVFSRLPDGNWWRDVEFETSFDYVATGLPKDASRWSVSFVFVIPIVKGR